MTDFGFPLTTAEFTTLYPNSIDADALQMLLDAAAEEIIDRAGETIDGYVVTDRTEPFEPHGDLIRLSERASAITSVVEYAQALVPTTLAADDYALSSSGRMLRRLRTGTNGAYRWHRRVEVTYTPYSDNASRSRVQQELVKLSIIFNPGLVSETIGDWAQTFKSGITAPYNEERDAILATLPADPVVMF